MGDTERHASDSKIFLQEAVRKLLKAGSNVDNAKFNGVTPLMAAVVGGKHKVIKALLKAGADATVPDKDGYTVMHVAADKGHERGA